jgi:hypothetical protein
MWPSITGQQEIRVWFANPFYSPCTPWATSVRWVTPVISSDDLFYHRVPVACVYVRHALCWPLTSSVLLMTIHLWRSSHFITLPLILGMWAYMSWRVAPTPIHPIHPHSLSCIHLPSSCQCMHIRTKGKDKNISGGSLGGRHSNSFRQRP